MTIALVRQANGLESLIEWLDEAGRTFEIIDGTVVVSPSPTLGHNDWSGRIYAQLLAACPQHLIVALNVGWRYDPGQPTSYLEPDLAVLDRARVRLTDSLHDEPPLLAMETRSPSTWRLDEGIKKDLYAEGGVASYWLLDPVTVRLRVLELRDGEYVETAVVHEGGALSVEKPFPVTIRL